MLTDSLKHDRSDGSQRRSKNEVINHQLACNLPMESRENTTYSVNRVQSYKLESEYSSTCQLIKLAFEE